MRLGFIADQINYNKIYWHHNTVFHVAIVINTMEIPINLIRFAIECVGIAVAFHYCNMYVDCNSNLKLVTLAKKISYHVGNLI